MKTATLDDLRNHLSTIVGWLENGEDVMLKSKPPSPPSVTPGPVDLSKSAAFRDRTGEPLLRMSKEELQEFYQEMRGRY